MPTELRCTTLSRRSSISNPTLGRSRVVRLGMGAVVAFALAIGTGCVPYVKHQEAVKELDRANEINDSLKLALANWQKKVAMTGADGRIAKAQYDALQTKYDALERDRQALLDTYNALKEKIQGMSPGVPMPSGSGFAEEDRTATGLDLSERGNLIIEGLSFDPGKQTLKAGPKRELDQLAALIQSKYPNTWIHLDGHTDNTPIKSSAKVNADNWDLSVKRAHAVYQYLVSKGCNPEQFQLHGYGYTIPADGVVDVNSAEGRAKNRRVEVRLGAPRQ